MPVSEGHGELTEGHDDSGSEQNEKCRWWRRGGPGGHGRGENRAKDCLAGEDGRTVFGPVKATDQDDHGSGSESTQDGQEIIETRTGRDSLRGEKDEHRR